MVVAGYEFTVVSSQSEMIALFIHKIYFTSPGDFVVIDTLLLRPNSIKKTFGELSKRVHTWGRVIGGVPMCVSVCVFPILTH